MSEKQLLLPSVKLPTLSPLPSRRNYIQLVMVAIGVFVILIGVADVSSRIAHAALGSQTNTAAFGPAVALTPLPTQTIATTTPIIPAHLTIPAIGVSADVQQVGKKADGTMAAPSNFTEVAWYALGSKPGEAGNAVIAGHVDNALTKAGVFEYLSDLKVGDSITIADSVGNTLTYMVTETDAYSSTQAPIASIFATTGPSQLVLVTCDGDWIPAAHSFNERFVVYASLIAH